MAVAFNSVSTDTGGGSTSEDVNHTTAGSNRLLLLWAINYPSENQTGPAVTGATYNGVAMTLIGNVTDGLTSDESHCYLFALANPTLGTNVAEVTWDGTTTEILIIAMSFTGVDQTTPVDTFQSAQGTDNTPTVNVTSTSGDMVCDCTLTFNRTFTVGAGQTQRATLNGTNTDTASSTEPGSTTTTMSWTLSSSQSWGIGAVNINQAVINQTINVDKGDLTLTQQDPSVFIASSLTEGALVLTGQQVDLSAIFGIVVDPASLSFTGKEIGIGANFNITVEEAIMTFNAKNISGIGQFPVSVISGTFDKNNKTI